MSLIDEIDNHIEYITSSGRYNNSLSILKRARDELARREWIRVEDKLPDEEPHRNIEILKVDAVGTVFNGVVSSRLIKAVNCYVWREAEKYPPPPATPDEGQI